MAVVAPGISGLGQPLHWSDKERRLWVGLLFVGCVLCYAGRNSMAVSIVEMSSEFNWNKRACVSHVIPIIKYLQLLKYLHELKKRHHNNNGVKIIKYLR